MTKTLNLEFVQDGFKCYAIVSYTQPLGKWEADSDLDYYGGYDVEDMLFLDEEGNEVSREDSGITYQDIFREFERVEDTSDLCYEGGYEYYDWEAI